MITKIKLSEISLVDRPANPEAVIDLWKAGDEAEPAAPGNDAVKMRAAAMAKVAGRSGAWKDYVAKARAALICEAPAVMTKADDDEDDDDDEAATDNSAPGDDDLGQEPSSPDDLGTDDDAQDDASQDDSGDVAAQLADLAGEDPDALQAAHDALTALGATCDPDNCPDAEKTMTANDLAKLDGAALMDAMLAKALPRVEALERRLEAHGAMIERLAGSPAPPKTAASGYVRAVGKAEDADPESSDGDLSPDEAQKAFAALTADERAFLLMKAALRQPIPVG